MRGLALGLKVSDLGPRFGIWVWGLRPQHWKNVCESFPKVGVQGNLYNKISTVVYQP